MPQLLALRHFLCYNNFEKVSSDNGYTAFCKYPQSITDGATKREINMRKNRLICIVLLICITLTFGGCGLITSNIQTQTTEYHFASTALTTPPSTIAPVVSTTEPTLPTTSEATTFSAEEQTQQTTTEISTAETSTAPSFTTPGFTTGSTPPEFYDLVSLSAYLNAAKEADITELFFRYSGIDYLDASMIARMTNSCYVSYYETDGLYELYLTEYPGDRIVDAWNANDTSTLTEDELYALNVATEIVCQAEDLTQNPFELELFLHDYLIEYVTYYDETRDIFDPLNPPRNLTAVGALLDGYANCQGYSDAFYVLASMAGFRVGRMSVFTPSDLHTVNTIFIDGSWYIVDVTFDDTDNEGSNHRLLNAGEDVIFEYSWHDYNQTCEIAATSDENYYYNYYDLVYTDINSMAAEIAQSYANGEAEVFRAMLLCYENSDMLNSVLYDELSKLNVSFSYTYWYNFTGRDTVYTIYFE